MSRPYICFFVCGVIFCHYSTGGLIHPFCHHIPSRYSFTTLCRHGDFILHIHPTETAVRSQCYYVEMPNVNLRGRFLTPRNVHVDEFNEEMLQHLPGNAR